MQVGRRPYSMLAVAACLPHRAPQGGGGTGVRGPVGAAAAWAAGGPSGGGTRARGRRPSGAAAAWAARSPSGMGGGCGAESLGDGQQRRPRRVPGAAAGDRMRWGRQVRDRVLLVLCFNMGPTVAGKACASIFQVSCVGYRLLSVWAGPLGVIRAFLTVFLFPVDF